MSVRAMQAVFDSPPEVLGPVARLVCLALADYCGENWLAWQSRESLARRCGVSDSTIKRTLRELRDDGILTVLVVTDAQAPALLAAYPELAGYLAIRPDRRPTLYVLDPDGLSGTERGVNLTHRENGGSPTTPREMDGGSEQGERGVKSGQIQPPRGVSSDPRSQLRDTKDPNARARTREAPGFSPVGEAGPDRSDLAEGVLQANRVNEARDLLKMAELAEARGEHENAALLRQQAEDLAA